MQDVHRFIIKEKAKSLSSDRSTLICAFLNHIRKPMQCKQCAAASTAARQCDFCGNTENLARTITLLRFFVKVVTLLPALGVWETVRSRAQCGALAIAKRTRLQGSDTFITLWFTSMTEPKSQVPMFMLSFVSFLSRTA